MTLRCLLLVRFWFEPLNPLTDCSGSDIPPFIEYESKASWPSVVGLQYSLIEEKIISKKRWESGLEFASEVPAGF